MMMMNMLCVFVVVSYLSMVTAEEGYNLTSTKFNLDEANKNLWLSAAAYCGADNIESVS